MKKLKDLKPNTLVIIENNEFVHEIGDLTKEDINDIISGNKNIYIAKEMKYSLDVNDFIEDLIEQTSYKFEDNTQDGWNEQLHENIYDNEEFIETTKEFLKKFKENFPVTYIGIEKVEV